MAIDLHAAARTYRRRQEQKKTTWLERLHAMQGVASELIAHTRDAYQPIRIYQWGSLLNPRFFTMNSDIDIAVEGVVRLESWLQLEKNLFEMTDYPLDLVKWEYLLPEHREHILRRGRIVFNRE